MQASSNISKYQVYFAISLMNYLWFPRWIVGARVAFPAYWNTGLLSSGDQYHSGWR